MLNLVRGWYGAGGRGPKRGECIVVLQDCTVRGRPNMVVGVGIIELLIHNSASLKAKRHVVKSILGKVRSKFDLSIAEVDNHDKWQRCTIGFAVVTNERGHAHSLLENITAYVENLHMAEVIDSKIEIVNY